MQRLKRIAKLALGLGLAAVAVWFEAVRRAPEVRRRKARRRARRGRSARSLEDS